MNERPYSFSPPRIDFRYEFTSVSAQKEVRKLVHFSPTDEDEFYNLALLDILDDGSTSDLTDTNNYDMPTVLATVMQIIVDFFHKNPESFVFIQGSDTRRQRLYQIVINRELELIEKQFRVLGYSGTDIEIFQRNHPYEYFIISKKAQP